MVTAAFLILVRNIRERYADRLNRIHCRRQATLTILLETMMGVLVTTTSVGAGAIGVTVLLLLDPKMRVLLIVGVRLMS
jgi:uncharacterized protein